MNHGPFSKNVFMGLLDAKVALVTGASRGIGAEIARRFGAEGAAVAVAARTTDGAPAALPGTIDETAAEISRAGGTAAAIPADLARPSDRERLGCARRRWSGSPPAWPPSCTTTTSRSTYSQELLGEFGVAVPRGG